MEYEFGNLLAWHVWGLAFTSIATAKEQLKPLERIEVRASEDGAQFVIIGNFEKNTSKDD